MLPLNHPQALENMPLLLRRPSHNEIFPESVEVEVDNGPN